MMEAMRTVRMTTVTHVPSPLDAPAVQAMMAVSGCAAAAMGPLPPLSTIRATFTTTAVRASAGRAMASMVRDGIAMMEAIRTVRMTTVTHVPSPLDAPAVQAMMAVSGCAAAAMGPLPPLHPRHHPRHHHRKNTIRVMFTSTAMRASAGRAMASMARDGIAMMALRLTAKMTDVTIVRSRQDALRPLVLFTMASM